MPEPARRKGRPRTERRTALRHCHLRVLVRLGSPPAGSWACRHKSSQLVRLLRAPTPDGTFLPQSGPWPVKRQKAVGASVCLRLPGNGHSDVSCSFCKGKGPVRLTVGRSHLPPASHAVQPDGGALGKGEGPEPGRHGLVGRHLMRRHRRPGCWLQKQSKRL